VQAIYLIHVILEEGVDNKDIIYHDIRQYDNTDTGDYVHFPVLRPNKTVIVDKNVG
jgi:hypothetical protein